MSAADSRAAAPAASLRVTIALWLALQATLIPLVSAISTGPWVWGALAMSAVLLGVGYLLRRRRSPAVAVSGLELVVGVALTTVVFFPGQSLLTVIPTGETFEAARRLVQSAASEILLGVAPLPSTTALDFVVVAAFGVLTIALDHVVLTARMPLLASIALVAVWLVPAIAVPSGVDVVAFVVLAACILFLLRADTRTREAPPLAGRRAGVAPVAVAIGAVAIIAALVVGPALPPPIPLVGAGGQITTIDARLDLGNDLRQRSDTPVLSMYSDASTPPYLRVATLSVFDGDVWMPDRLRSVPLESSPLEPVDVPADVRVVEYRTFVTISRLSSAYLPVSFPAVEVTGLEGLWRSVPYSRTILSAQSNAQGQDYEIVSHVPRPTLEQIRAADADIAESRIDLRAIAEGTPPVIAELAAAVTADAATDYDRLIALQDWFQGSDFTYSLTTPVADGFDGSSADAVARFLEVKEGYCVHFAGAFALMARTLGMPTRIVVGFLPGDATGDTVDGMRVTEATTGQLHAWPEVHFDGIGWVPFEPTKSLGTETRFSSAAITAADDGGTDVGEPTATPTATASAKPSAGPDVADRDTDGGAVSPGVGTIDPRPALTIVGIAALILLAPAAAGAVRRGWLRQRARGGDVGAAWRYVQDAAIDLGIRVTPAESPRAFGARLVTTAGAPRGETQRLVTIVERASYAPTPDRSPGSAGDVGADAAVIRTALRAARAAVPRTVALFAPRSLLVRPGSAFAERATEPPAPLD